jgi:ElaB/YqjD/DUF883 family membrane-anchored ribosome-binding protein
METVTEKNIQESVNAAIDQANDYLQKAEGASAEEAKILRAHAQEALSKAKEHLGTYYQKFSTEGQQIACQVNECVHENPWRAVGIACAVGVLIGALIARK